MESHWNGKPFNLNKKRLNNPYIYSIYEKARTCRNYKNSSKRGS